MYKNILLHTHIINSTVVLKVFIVEACFLLCPFIIFATAVWILIKYLKDLLTSSFLHVSKILASYH